ncbi:MAG: FtsX-like permease family protein, partial [Gemmatimonadota bacterium]|nr:FtsX-like permease family protein [Gemmatimonadota bacterium]
PLTAAIGGGRGADAAGGRGPMRRLLIALESALAVVLVIGAALLGRSFLELSRIDLGFDSRNVLVGGLTVPAAAYPEPEDVGTFFRDLTDRVARLPGVRAAAAVRKVPLGESIGSWTITLEEPLPDPDAQVEPDWQVVTPAYFDVMGLELREGRFFEPGDRAGGHLVAVISETMARRVWPDGTALGRRFQLGTLNQPLAEIVGVAGDVRHNEVLEDARVEMYLLHDQWPELRGGGGPIRTMSLAVRTDGDPLALMPAVRRELAAIDPSIPLADPRPMALVTGGALAEERFTAGVFGLFAGLALALAAIGLYGVTAYTTSRRTNELGIRLALGADGGQVARMVVREAVGIAGAGVIVGGFAAAWLTRFLSSQLYGISPLDTGTFVAVPLGLVAVAGFAAYLPARRAARIDPALALRSER